MVGGGVTSLATLRGLSRLLAALSVLAAVTLAGFGAYNIAWFQSVRAELADAPAELAKRARLLEDIRIRLGHGGFLQSLALYAETGRPDARTDMNTALETAEAALKTYERQVLTTAEGALVRDIRRLIDNYRRTLAATESPAALAGPPSLLLMTQHAALADRIADVRRVQALDDFDRLTDGARRGFWLGVAAVLVTLSVVAAVIIMINQRLLGPLSDIRRGLIGVVRGDWRVPVWGVDRDDEFGDLARIIDAFRVQAMNIPDISVLNENGRTKLKFEGAAADLFEAVSGKLREAGALLADNSGQVADTVGEVRREVTDMLQHVQTLCAAVARSASESSREIRQQTEVLGRAAAQVRAFDDQGPSGGLDALVANLRRNAELLAETVQTVGAEVGMTMRGLMGTEQEIREAAEETRAASALLSNSMLGVQEKLLNAVRLIRSSGEFLTNSAVNADSNLSRAVEALAAGEQALAEALSRSTARIDAAAERLDLSVQSQLARAVGTLGDTEQTLVEVLNRATDRLDTMGERLDVAVAELDSRAAAAERVFDERAIAAERIFDERSTAAERILDERSTAAERLFDERSAAAERGFSLRAMAAEQTFEERAANAEQGFEQAVGRLDTAASALQSAAAGMSDRIADGIAARLTDVMDEFRALQTGIDASAADVSGRASELGGTIGAFQEILDGLAAELERRKAEPDRRAAAEATMRRLQEIADTLGSRMEAVERMAEGIGGVLTAGLTDATERLSAAAESVTTRGESLTDDVAAAVRERMIEIGRVLDAKLSGTIAAADGLADRIGGSLEAAGAGLRATVADMQNEIDALAAQIAADAGSRLGTVADGMERRLDALDAATRQLSNQLTQGLDGVLDRLRDAAADVQQESRALAADAAGATSALTKVMSRQEQVTETLREVASGLGKDPRMAALTAVVDTLKGRLDEIDRLGRVLDNATGVLGHVAEERAAKAVNAKATMELGERLAEIAAQLRDVAGDSLPPPPPRPRKAR